jgi:hypothetical protein
MILFRISASSNLDSIARWDSTKIKQTIDIKKCLILIIWYVNGINSLLDVLKNIAYNSIFFYGSVVSDLIESICAYSWRKTLKCIMLHLDDARPHNSRQSTECLEQFRARIVPYPDYSPDLEPSNFLFFFFFGSVKSKLPGLAIRSRDYLIYEILRIFEEIPKITLISICASWMKQCK